MYEVDWIEKYDGPDGETDLSTWKQEVGSILAKEDLEFVLDGKQSSMEANEWRKLDAYVGCIIRCYISDEIRSIFICDTMSAKEVWDALENYDEATYSNRMNIKRIIDEDSTMEDIIEEFSKLPKELTDQA